MRELMKRFKWLSLAAVLAVALAGLMVGCAAPGAKETGSLVINLADEMSSRTMLGPYTDTPGDFSMDAGSYIIDGTGTSGRAFDEGATFHEHIVVGNPLTLTKEVLPGGWHVLVTVMNNSAISEAVGDGFDDVVVSVEAITTATIHAVSFHGTNASTNFSCSFGWASGVLTTPSIEVELLPKVGDAIPIPMDIYGNFAAASGWTHPVTGWYVALMRLYDQGVLDIGAVDIARIALNKTTLWSIPNIEVAQLQGQMIVDFDYDNSPPLALQTTPDAGSLPVLPTETKNLVVDSADFDGTEIGVYSWYKNGALIQLSDTNSLSVDASKLYLNRLYNYSVIVWQNDGRRIGTATWGVRSNP